MAAVREEIREMAVKIIEPVNGTIEEILARKRKEIERTVTQLEIDENEIKILKNCLDQMFERESLEYTAEDVLKEISEILIKKYKITTKSILCDVLVLLYDVLDL